MIYTETDTVDDPDFQTEYVSLDRSAEAIAITDADYLLEVYLSQYEGEQTETSIPINEDYTFRADQGKTALILYIENQAGESVLEVNLDPLFTQAFAASTENMSTVSPADMTLIAENDEIGLTILALKLMKNKSENMMNANLYLFINIK